jgi:SAM-dependent methyltransferase
LPTKDIAFENVVQSGQFRNCPQCNSESFQKIDTYCRNEWSVGACRDCGFVYLRNPPGNAALVEAYAWEKTSIEENRYRLAERKIGARLSRASRWRLGIAGRSSNRLLRYFSNGNVLDIGCGSGGKLMKAGGIPHGIEISQKLHAVADGKMQSRGGHAVHAAATEGIKSFPESFFSAILLNSFLEHELEPAELLGGLHRILEPKGHVYVRVPNFGSLNRRFMQRKWCGFRYPDHVNYFTVASLREMAESHGFRMKLLNPFNIYFDDNIKALLTRAE